VSSPLPHPVVAISSTLSAIVIKGLLGLSIGWRMMMRKILYFLGGRAREGGSAIYPLRRSHMQGVSGGVLQRGGSLVGVDNGLLPCGGVTRCHDDENFIIAAGPKWLGRSIFVGKTNLGGTWGSISA